jgi:hypothetical protein
MAVVMAGVGLVMIAVRGRIAIGTAGTRFAPVATYLPVAAGAVVLALGLYLTLTAVASTPAL